MDPDAPKHGDSHEEPDSDDDSDVEQESDEELDCEDDEPSAGSHEVDGTATGWTLSPEKLVDLVVKLYGITPADLPNGRDSGIMCCDVSVIIMIMIVAIFLKYLFSSILISTHIGIYWVAYCIV